MYLYIFFFFREEHTEEISQNEYSVYYEVGIKVGDKQHSLEKVGVGLNKR